MLLLIWLVFCLGANAYVEIKVPDSKNVYDLQLYQDVLDKDLCQRQMKYLVENNTQLLARFLDAGLRTPRGFLDGNFADLGNYYQCLNIDHEVSSTSPNIKGKYCTINVPLAQEIKLPSLPTLPEWPNITWPELPWPELNPKTSRVDQDLKENIAQYGRMRNSALNQMAGGIDRVAADSALGNFSFLLAVCVPKSCTTEQAVSEILRDPNPLGIEYKDNYCRLPNDKKWVPADYVAITVFSFLLLLVIASTGYDVYQTVLLENDPKRLNQVYQCFSVYTNSRRLFSYTPIPGAIECLDGVRSFAMMWVIIGHTYVNQVADLMANILDAVNWITKPQAIWVTMAPITVDTFFMISGLLLVYTTAGKMSKSRLLKNLHLFYLNRLLRMFPVLAAFILLQTSIINRISDGPNWTVVQDQTERCRVYWWTTLLHVQNWVNPGGMCLPHSWYLAIDVQLYIISPLVLFWVLGNRRTCAWIALFTALILSVAGATVYNFVMEFQPGPFIPSGTPEDQSYYLAYYYVNTLTRSSPFFVGMIYGYIFHVNRNQRLQLSNAQVCILWACALVIMGLVTYITYPILQPDWDNQTVNNIINSFMRPCWAMAIGWLVLACHHGYAGPINWVLTLRCFKVMGRLSYAMYIVHYPLIFMVNSSKIAPGFFTPTASLFKFLADFALATIVAYLLTLLVDSPCSTLIKRFLGGGKRPRPAPPKVAEEDNQPNGQLNRSYVNDETKNSSL